MTIVRRTAGWLLSLALTGCVTRIPFEHGPIEPPVVARDGVLVVRPFIDCRPHDHADIGTLRNLLAMPVVRVVAADPRPLAHQVTEHWSDALRRVGYRVVDQADPDSAIAAPTAAVLEGRVEEFWMDTWFALWHTIVVRVCLRDPDGGPARWEHTFTAHDRRPLWLGAPGEYSACIGAALDAALAEAVREFSSAAFADLVR